MITKCYVVPVNPEPWKVGPVHSGRKKGGGFFASVGRDATGEAFKQGVKEHLLAQGAEVLPGPYALRFLWYRQLIQYQGPKRKVTKNRVDSTNMQKLAEDSLQGVLIDNDRNVLSVSSEIVEQDTDAPGMFVVIVHADLDCDIRGTRVINPDPLVPDLGARITTARASIDARTYFGSTDNDWGTNND